MQEEILQRVAEEGVALAERHAVAEDHPQHRHHRHQHQAVHHGGQHVLAPHQAAVEQDQPRRGHHQHQRGTDQHPGVVAGVDGRGRSDGRHGRLQTGDAFFEARGFRRGRAGQRGSPQSQQTPQQQQLTRQCPREIHGPYAAQRTWVLSIRVIRRGGLGESGVTVCAAPTAPGSAAQANSGRRAFGTMCGALFRPCNGPGSSHRDDPTNLANTQAGAPPEVRPSPSNAASLVAAASQVVVNCSNSASLRRISRLSCEALPPV